MPLVVKDRVKETSTTTGTGTLTLSDAPTGFQTFSSAIGNTNTTYYTIDNGAQWEVGIGTVGAGTLTRDTVIESSSGGAKIDLSAGTKQVFCTYPAEESVDQDTAQTLTNKTLAEPTIVGTIIEDIFALTDSSTVDIDPANGSIQTLTLAGTGRTLTFTNMVNGEAITLMINDGTAGTVTTWNATFVNNAGVAPTLSLTGFTVVSIWKVAGTVYAAVVGNA
jgi:hypothetical protein